MLAWSFDGFEQNIGQHSEGDFLFYGDGHRTSIDNGTLTSVSNAGSSSPLVITLLDADPNAEATGVDERDFITNYYFGNNSSQWYERVPWHRAVRYDDILSGVDQWIHKSNSGRAEYTFVVAAGSDPDSIQLEIAGADSLALDTNGNLVATQGAHTFVQEAPIAFQLDDEGNQLSVSAQFVLTGDFTFAFDIGVYDVNRDLTIDPTFFWASTRGGGTSSDSIEAMTADLVGHTWSTGTTRSVKVPISVGDSSPAASTEVFVVKRDPFGTDLGATFVGGSNAESGSGIVRDDDGNVYVTGWTQSTNFPTRSASQTSLGGLTDAFLLRLNDDLTIDWSTYWGGTGFERGNDVAVDAGNNLFVSGTTGSTDFPLVGSTTEPAGGSDAFVMRVLPDGQIATSRTIGGSSSDFGKGIAVAPDQSVVLVGDTSSMNYPTTPGVVQREHGGQNDLYVTIFSNDLGEVLRSTYSGDDGHEVSSDVAIQSSGVIAIVGTDGKVGDSNPVNGDMAIYLIDSTLATPATTRRIGGFARDNGHAITVDTEDNLHAVGTAQAGSNEFSDVNWTPPGTSAGIDGIYAMLDPQGTILTAGRYGGIGDDEGNAVAVDFSGHVYVGGSTDSETFPLGQGDDLQVGGGDFYIANFLPENRDMTWQQLQQRALLRKQQPYARFNPPPNPIIDFPAVTNLDEASISYTGLIPFEDLFVDGRVRLHDTKLHFDLFTDLESNGSYQHRTWDETHADYSNTPVDPADIGLSGKVIARISAGLTSTFQTSYTIVGNGYARYQGAPPMKEGASHRTAGLFDVFDSDEKFASISEAYVRVIPGTDQLELMLLIDNDFYVMAQRQVFTPGDVASLMVENVILPRMDIDPALHPESGPGGFSSLHVRDEEDGPGQELHDSDVFFVGLDLNDDGQADELVTTRLVNPGEGIITVRHFEDMYDGTPVFFGLDQRDLNPENYFDDDPTVRYVDRASYVTVVDTSVTDVNLGVHLHEEGQPSDLEFNDNIVAFASYDQTLNEAQTLEDAYHYKTTTFAYFAVDDDQNGITNQVESLIDVASVDHHTDLVVGFSCSEVAQDVSTVVATITRNNRVPSDEPITIELTSDNPSRASVPSFVTLPANADSVSFDVTVAGGDLGQVEIAANAEYHFPGIATLTIGNDAKCDFGDAPAPYPTLAADGGASHLDTGPRLGAMRDAENDGAPAADADGDDLTADDDEDGVMFGVIRERQVLAGVNVHLQNAATAKVDAWIDFNRNGAWEASEKILDSVVIQNGLQTLNYHIPAGVATGDAIARVRVSSDGNLLPTGFAADGEVEDHVVTISDSLIVESVIVNDGDPQRSSVEKVTVTFDRTVDIDGDPFEFINTDTATAVTEIPVVSVENGKTVVNFTFQPGPSVNPAGSLLDGVYRLTIDATKVTAGGQSLDGDDDGAAGGNFVFGDETHDNFFRKYGDHNGNNLVELFDFAAFRGTYNKPDTDPDYLAMFDADGDTDIDLFDFAAFRNNFGS